MKTILHKISLLILPAVLICSILPFRADASYEIPGTCQVQTDTGVTGTVKTLDYGYDYNTYLSLRDIAMVLRDTDKSFSLEITKNTVSMNPGGVYVPVGVENVPWEDSENPDISLRRNEFKVNGQNVHYYTLIMRLPSDYYDCFIMAADLAMILDVDIAVPSAGAVEIHTQEPFSISPGLPGTVRIFLRGQQRAGGRCHHRGTLLWVSVRHVLSHSQHFQAYDLSPGHGGHFGGTDYPGRAGYHFGGCSTAVCLG